MGRLEGLDTTNVFQWLMVRESHWHGLPSNDKVLKLLKSILLQGFKGDEPVRARTSTRTCTRYSTSTGKSLRYQYQYRY